MPLGISDKMQDTIGYYRLIDLLAVVRGHWEGILSVWVCEFRRLLWGLHGFFELGVLGW